MLPQELESHIAYDASYALKRGQSIAFVPQNPFTALSPLTKIDKQFMASQEEAEKYLRMVGLEIDFFRSLSLRVKRWTVTTSYHSDGIVD